MTESTPDQIVTAAAARTHVDRPGPEAELAEIATQHVFLDYLRSAVIAKLTGLTEAQARAELVPSGTTLLWLGKHVASVEAFWLHHAWAGDPDEVIPDDDDLAGDTVASVLGDLERVCVRTAALLADPPNPDRHGRIAVHGRPRTLRWTLNHLLEEVGRHAGHADILREQIDGRTGR